MADRKPLVEQLTEAVRAKADVLSQTPFGRMVLEWQDGRLVFSETTAKDKYHSPAPQPHK